MTLAWLQVGLAAAGVLVLGLYPFKWRPSWWVVPLIAAGFLGSAAHELARALPPGGGVDWLATRGFSILASVCTYAGIVATMWQFHQETKRTA
jgi:hypothetical protein